ncbi:MAG TPA: winged helix domain-containing protein, partial [Polyangiales bacterium]
ISACAEHLIESAREDLRFCDPEREVAEQPSRISLADLAQLRELVRSGLAFSDDDLDQLLGRSLTRPKLHLEVDAESHAEDGGPEGGELEGSSETLAVRSVERRLARGERLVRRLGARLLLVPRAADLWLFADGQHHQLELIHLAWLEPLAEGAAVDETCSKRCPGALPWLATLLGRGCVVWQADAKTQR